MNNFFKQYRTAIPLAVLAILLLFLAAAHYGLVPLAKWASHMTPTKNISATVTSLATTNKPVQVLRTGVIESPKSAPMQAEFSGTITQVYVTEGQVVKADQPLVQITRFGSSNAASLPPSSSSPLISPQSQMNYENALKDYNRFQKLYEQGAIAKRQLDAAEARLQAATDLLAMSEPAQAAQPIANNGYQSTTAPITLTALTPGTVSGLSAVMGQTVSVGQQLLVVAVGEVQAVIHVDQKDLYLLHAGTQATIENTGHKIMGQVGSIFPEIDVNNVSSFRTHISIPNNTDGFLKAGMPVNVMINTGKSVPVSTLPSSAILHSPEGTSYIYLLDNGKALRQEITTGETIGDSTEITSSLPEHALIITSNLNLINPNDHITMEK